MIVDAHHHVWRPARGDYGWMDAAPEVLLRDYMPEDLAPSLRRFGVTRTIAVQAAQTRAETDFLLDIASRTEFVAGVVGWLDMEAADFETQLAHYTGQPKFVGLRPMLQDLNDDAWILQPKVLRSLATIAESGLAFDFLTYTRHLAHVEEALRMVPTLRAVIDHLAKPPIASGALDAWRDAIKRISRFENVSCKLSGLITEAVNPGWPGWRVADLEPVVHHAVSCFGPDRLIFGSDWPVCRVAGDYGDVLASTMLALPRELRADTRIFAGNARRFYRLPAETAPASDAS